MRKNNLSQDSVYHIFNRGTDKRAIFMNSNDYLRFVNNLVIFNDTEPATNTKHRLLDIQNGTHERVPLVDILAFCLMPNHFHLLLKQRGESSITEFMRKLGCGYVNYFNLKHSRSGTLFQGRFKSVLIDNESQFLYIPFYIHLNPLDMLYQDWRENGVKERKKAIEFLDDYKWSSHINYRGKPNFPLILEENVVAEYFGNEDNYSEEIYNFLKDFNFSRVSDLLLE